MGYEVAGMAKQKSSSKSEQHHRDEVAEWTAKTADKHLLYERSVQDPERDIKFIDRLFSKHNGRRPLSLREDFCGTALLCAEWVRKGKERRAIGIDTDGSVLRWAKSHNIAPLNGDADRVQLLKRNVLHASGQTHDVAVAFNFSYCVFMARQELLRYCSGVLKELNPGGLFVLDIHGGTELTAAGEDETEHEGFTYVWDQRPFDAINGTSTRHIHFKFPDGTKLNRAFTYHWRLWTLQELRDVLLEAGFSEVDVFWEGSTKDGSGNGRFRKTKKADQEISWIAYVAAWK
jgi:SAM-dependent methyltransferase